MYNQEHMRKLVSFFHVSLDGYVAGLNGEMDWGMPLFKNVPETTPLTLVSSKTFANGVVCIG